MWNLEVIEKIKIAHLILIRIFWVSFDEQGYQKFQIHEVQMLPGLYLQAIFCLFPIASSTSPSTCAKVKIIYSNFII